MADVFPAGATVIIDTESEAGSYAALFRLQHCQQHARHQQLERLRQAPINFDTIAHFGSAITPWEAQE